MSWHDNVSWQGISRGTGIKMKNAFQGGKLLKKKQELKEEDGDMKMHNLNEDKHDKER